MRKGFRIWLLGAGLDRGPAAPLTGRNPGKLQEPPLLCSCWKSFRSGTVVFCFKDEAVCKGVGIPNPGQLPPSLETLLRLRIP